MLKRDGFKLFICAMVAAFFLALPFVVTSLNGAEKNESEYKKRNLRAYAKRARCINSFLPKFRQRQRCICKGYSKSRA